MIAAATEVLYTQSTQLFPGPDDTVTHQVKLAIDQEAEIVYWLVPQPATGYISLVYLGLNRETPMKGHDNSIVFAGVFDGLLRPTQLGMPKICFFFKTLVLPDIFWVTKLHLTSSHNKSCRSHSVFTWVFPKIGGKPQKWMVYNGKPYYNG